MKNPFNWKRSSSSPSQRSSAAHTKATVDKLARRYARKFKREYDLDPAPSRSRVVGTTSDASASTPEDPGP